MIINLNGKIKNGNQTTNQVIFVLSILLLLTKKFYLEPCWTVGRHSASTIHSTMAQDLPFQEQFQLQGPLEATFPVASSFISFLLAHIYSSSLDYDS